MLFFSFELCLVHFIRTFFTECSYIFQFGCKYGKTVKIESCLKNKIEICVDGESEEFQYIIIFFSMICSFIPHIGDK